MCASMAAPYVNQALGNAPLFMGNDALAVLCEPDVRGLGRNVMAAERAGGAPGRGYTITVDARKAFREVRRSS